MDLMESRAIQDEWDLLAPQDLRDLQGRSGQQDQMAAQVKPVPRVCQDFKAHLGLKALLVIMATPAPQALQGFREPQAGLDLQAGLVDKDLRARLGWA